MIYVSEHGSEPKELLPAYQVDGRNLASLINEHPEAIYYFDDPSQYGFEEHTDGRTVREEPTTYVVQGQYVGNPEWFDVSIDRDEKSGKRSLIFWQHHHSPTLWSEFRLVTRESVTIVTDTVIYE